MQFMVSHFQNGTISLSHDSSGLNYQTVVVHFLILVLEFDDNTFLAYLLGMDGSDMCSFKFTCFDIFCCWWALAGV